MRENDSLYKKSIVEP